MNNSHIVYGTRSWHYRLVLYVYGEEFFTIRYFDHSCIKTDEDLQKMFESPNEFQKTKPKHVNFCPYCRAVVVSIVLLPFAAILKRIPKKTRKDMTLEELKKSREKRMRMLFGILASYHFVMGFINIIVMKDSFWWGFIQIVFGIMFLFFPEVSKIIKKSVLHLISLYNKPKSVVIRSKIRNAAIKMKPALVKLKILKIKIKIKPRKIPRPHSPPFIKAFFTENHEKYCPPIFFVDTSEEKNLT